MVGRWVRRGEPLKNVLFYLVPCGQASVSTIQVMEVEGHEHFISSMSFEIPFVLFTISFVLFIMSLVTTAISSVFFSMPSAVFASSPVVFSIPSVVFATSPIFPAMATLAFAESGSKMIWRKVGNLMGGLLTFFVLFSRRVNLSYGHLDLLPYQII